MRAAAVVIPGAVDRASPARGPLPPLPCVRDLAEDLVDRGEVPLHTVEQRVEIDRNDLQGLGPERTEAAGRVES